MQRILIAALALGLSGTGMSARSQERVYLTKADLEQTLVGKSHTFKAANGSTIKWELRPDHSLYYNNMSFAGTGGGANGSGTWEINDNGQLCVKWNRVESGNAGCNYFFKVGDQLSRSGGNKQDSRVNGEILSVK